MYVPAKDVTGVSGLDAFFRLRRIGDVGPLAGRGGTRMHEQHIVIPDGERQAGEKGALPFAKLGLRPGNGGLRARVQGIVGTAERRRVVVAEYGHSALRRMLLDQVEHGDGIRPVTHQVAEVYVHRLRKKLEPGGVRITTVRGVGYRLEAPA
jgi:hypothetical protein